MLTVNYHKVVMNSTWKHYVSISELKKFGHPWQPVANQRGSRTRPPSVLYVFEHKTKNILIHTPHTCTVAFWQGFHSQICCNTPILYNWDLCIPDGLSVVQCSLGHVIGVAFFYTISVAWSVRAGQLAADGVASVWRTWVRSPPGPR